MKAIRRRSDIIHYEGMQHAPENELGVVFLFGKVHRRLRFTAIDEIKPGFPDCWAWRRLTKGSERTWIEFEFRSSQSPATIPMNEKDLIQNARPYRMQRDLNLPPSFLIDDLAKGEIDIAVVWGPIAGYFAKNNKVPMEVRLIPEYENANAITAAKGKQYWNISIGVRKADKERMATIDAALERNKDKIDKILAEYGVPHVPVIADDSIVKLTHKKSEHWFAGKSRDGDRSVPVTSPSAARSLRGRCARGFPCSPGRGW